MNEGSDEVPSISNTNQKKMNVVVKDSQSTLVVNVKTDGEFNDAVEETLKTIK